MMSLIPRSATCPSFGGTSRSSPFTGGLSFLASRGQSSDGLGCSSRTPSSSGLTHSAGWPRPGMGAWRNLLVAVAILYGLAFLTLPIAYLRLTGGSPTSLGARTEPGVAGGRASLSRRLALQTLEWPETGLAQRRQGSGKAAQPRVEFRDAGYIVNLADALDASAWDDISLYQPGDAAAQLPDEALAGRAAGERAPELDSDAAPRLPAWCPRGAVRVFIGVTSRCCSPESQAKRAAIRATWAADARRLHPGVAVRFLLAQPADPAEAAAGLALLADEVSAHGDVVVVPGHERYRELPNKTLRLLRYALASPCNFTHVVKTDEDVYLRPQALLDVIATGANDFSVAIDAPPDAAARFDGVAGLPRAAPWLTGMYVGQLDSNKSGVWPGWAPLRDPANKWYLAEADLSDAQAAPLLGVRWASGWGYALSRDLVHVVVERAAAAAAAPAAAAPPWWGRMPWEDIMVAALLRGSGARVHHHDGFKAAWNDCGPGTVLKHLDNDAPLLQAGLHAQEASGLWARRGVTCATGDFTPNDYDGWRAWRNSLPDNQLNGFM
ncbi:hypothetical protein ACKKBF_B21315 [Auxenochlorella protothecoides x Auxenochlorella symbiontica]